RPHGGRGHGERAARLRDRLRHVAQWIYATCLRAGQRSARTVVAGAGVPVPKGVVMENRRPSPFPSYPPDRPRVRRYRVEPPPEDHPVRDAFVGMAAALAAAVVVAV